MSCSLTEVIPAHVLILGPTDRLLPTRFERVTFAFGGQRSTYAASIGMARSINRKNRVLRAPATTDSCDIGAGDPEGSPFAFWGPFRRDRVLRLPATRLSR
jgi:hypothetical protein